MQCGEHPMNDRSEHNARVTHSSRQHAKGRGGYAVHNRPKPRPAAAAAINTHQRSPSQRQRPPIHSKPKIVLRLSCFASIDLRSQHGRLVSARFNASVRKGVQGSCKRAASQAAGRAHRIVLQRSRPRRGEKEGSKGLPGQKFSTSTVCVFCLGRST